MQIRFAATLPAIQSAVKIGPDGCRVQLDIPNTEKAEYTKLQAYGFDRVLKVTVEVEEEQS
jgi:hypothetical protein